MPKLEKGILGVKKDPKDRMLFSFNPREADKWPSDDDDDSDFCPSDDEMGEAGASHVKVKKKRKSKSTDGDYIPNSAKMSPKKRKSPKHKTNSPNKTVPKLVIKRSSIENGEFMCKSQSVDSDSSNSGCITTCWSRLPWQVLHRIFSSVVDEEGALPFLCRISRVCNQWREVACHPSLWSKVDLSYGWIKLNEPNLRWLCENRLSRLRDINLSTSKTLTNSGIEILARNCTELEQIGLSYCIKVNSDGMRCLIDQCEHLKGLDLSYMSMDALSNVVLKHLIDKRGSQLTRLNLSGNVLRGFQPVFNLFYTQCPELRVLELNKIQFSNTTLSINIEQLQDGCRKLKVLQLSLTSYRAPYVNPRIQALSPGFRELEELCLAIDTNSYITVGLDDDFLHRVLKSSVNLKLLDLRGSSSIKCHTIQSLPATDLQQLFISLSSVAKYTGIEIIMSKWQHSLRELDLSWNLYPGMSLDCAMHKLSDDPSKSALEVLNLSGTSITCDRVKSLLEGCPKLHKLNLCSCRGLPRGMKRDYDRVELEQLRTDIDDILQEEQRANGGI